MDKKAEEAELSTQVEAGLVAKEVGNASEVKANASREAIRETRKRAKEAKLAAKAAKKAKKTEANITKQERKKRAGVDLRAKQTQAELPKELELATPEGTEKVTIEAREEARGETEKVREVEPQVYTAAKEEEGEKVNARLYEGTLNIVLMPPADVPQIKNLEETLQQIQNLRIVFIGGSVYEPMKIVVSAEQPTPLVDILSRIPIVDQVSSRGKEIQVSLK